jgi:uncharacterized protein (DUF2147 family)
MEIPMSLMLMAAALMAQSAAPAAAPTGGTANTAIGRWATPTKQGVVEIRHCGGSICGTLVDSEGIRANSDLRDIYNKNEAQRSRILKGIEILRDFRQMPWGWDKGTIYNADDGGTYKATITVMDSDTLNVKGCIVWPLCKSQTWKRIK